MVGETGEYGPGFIVGMEKRIGRVGDDTHPGHLFCKLMAVEVGFGQAFDRIFSSVWDFRGVRRPVIKPKDREVLLLVRWGECKNLSRKIYDVMDAPTQNVPDLEFGGRFGGRSHWGYAKEHETNSLAL